MLDRFTFGMFRALFFICFCFIFLSCGRAYIPVELKTLPRSERAKGQQDFDVRLIPLTKSSANKANKTPYARTVVEAGDISQPAMFFKANQAIKEVLPESDYIGPYLIGPGDVLSINRLVGGAETPLSSVFVDKVVSPLGFVTILDNIKIKASGLTLSEFEDIYFTEAIKTGKFETAGIQIKQFNSKKIYVGGGQLKPSSIPYTSEPTFLKDVLSVLGISMEVGADIKVTVKRGDKEYVTSYVRAQKKKNPFFRMFPGDSVSLSPIVYRPESVLIVGETGAQSSVKIDSLSRKSLSNVLFERSMISHVSSDFSQIYVLRKNNKEYLAYHLDITNPVRINLANEFEMRPDDIIFVAAQPLTTYNRALGHILGIVGITTTARNQIRSEIN